MNITTKRSINELSIRIDKAYSDMKINKSPNTFTIIDRELDNEISYKYAIETNTWIDDLYSLGNWFIGGNENTNAVNERKQMMYKSNNLMNTLSLKNFLKKITLHNSIFSDTCYEFVGFTGLKNNGVGRHYVEPIYKQHFIRDAELASSIEISNYMKLIGFKQTDEFKFVNEMIEVSDVRPRNVLKDKNGEIYIIDAEFKILNETIKAEPNYLNLFHKESSERKIKAIQEMKKTPMNYEQELMRHKKMHEKLQ